MHLVGYSYGAIVGFEMARMLRVQGRDCRLIMMDNSFDAVRMYEVIYRQVYKLEVRYSVMSDYQVPTYLQGDIVKSPVFESELTSGLAERIVDGLDKDTLSKNLQKLVFFFVETTSSKST